MDRLIPFSKLVDDYYLGDSVRDGAGVGPGESEDDMSSDDELKRELRKIAGIRREGDDDEEIEREGEGEEEWQLVVAGHASRYRTNGRRRRKSEFEQSMDAELDESLERHARSIMGMPAKEEKKRPKDEQMPPLEPDTDEEKGGDGVRKSPDKKRKTEEDAKQVTFNEAKSEEKEGKGEGAEDAEMLSEDEISGDEDDENPIRRAFKIQAKTNAANRSPKKKSALPLPDFYDADEDDDNERWMQERRRASQGRPHSDKAFQINMKSARLEDGSDAVLSCPGCMSLLTRDCQRHEIYKEQYRAMFVENCIVDREEKLTIEKSGKERRRERQKKRKEEAKGGGSSSLVAENDVFLPVNCAVCSTKVAVVDREEVFQFFNVLVGYS